LLASEKSLGHSCRSSYSTFLCDLHIASSTIDSTNIDLLLLLYTTLLDASHQHAVSGGRSHREQLAGGPGRLTPSRRVDWALSHPTWRLGVRIEESRSRFRPNRWLVERQSKSNSKNLPLIGDSKQVLHSPGSPADAGFICWGGRSSSTKFSGKQNDAHASSGIVFA
jgi:hypothetical protein